MRVNRIVLVIATLMLVLSVVVGGCGPTATPAPAEPTEAPPAEPTKAPEATATPEPAAAEAEVTITFWHLYTEAMAGANSWFKDMVAEFEKENPNIHVEMETFGSDPYKTKLPTALAAGEAADAIHNMAGNYLLPNVEEGALEPMDRYLDEGGWRDQFVPYTFDQTTFDGVTYCLPFSLRTVHIWYNKDVFSEYNLTPPETFEELLEIADTLKANGVTPFALGMKMAWQAWFWQCYLFERVAGYDAWLNAKNNTGNGWQDPGLIEALGIMQDMAEKGYFTEGTLGLDPMDVNTSFFDGEAAMILNGTFFVDQVKSLAPEGFLENKLGYFNFPIIEGGKGNPKIQHGGVGASYCINAASPHKDEVAKFYRFLFTPEHMKDLSARTNWVMSMKDSLPEDASPLLKSLAKEVEEMETYVWYMDYTVFPEAYMTFEPVLQALVDGSITPEEAAAKMQEAVD